jgi:diaminopropionate ammonia-lyase
VIDLGKLDFELFVNPRAGTPGIVTLPAGGFRRARAAITAWPGYAPTPLHDLPEIAAMCGVASVRLKDESGRFGLASFKALGGAYAVGEVLATELARSGAAGNASVADLEGGRYASATGAITVTCATDGNHGRAVAWGARRFGCRCVVLVHATVSEGRAEAIARYGAEIRRVAGNYDDAVRLAAETAAAEGWFVVSDTSWEGYTRVPVDVMQGYRLMPDEAIDQWSASSPGAPPTHVLIQGGVGGVAAAVSAQIRARLMPAPTLVVVEPELAACLLASARRGQPTGVAGDLDTIMAGLACGEPSLLAWTELERGAAAFMAVPDAAVGPCMRGLAGLGIEAGESGVAGLAGLLLAANDAGSRAALGLDDGSRVLLFGTEGATDPELYARMVGDGAAGLSP